MSTDYYYEFIKRENADIILPNSNTMEIRVDTVPTPNMGYYTGEVVINVGEGDDVVHTVHGVSQISTFTRCQEWITENYTLKNRRDYSSR